MNFHPRFDKSVTPQKNKASDASPTVKRLRLTSPSPSPIMKKTLFKSKDHGISLSDEDPNSKTDIKDNEVFLIQLNIILIL